MNRKLFSIFLLIAISRGICVAEEDSRLGFPKCSEISLRLGKQSWAKDLRQIPATVIDKGVMRNVPYISFQSGDCELNVYGDPDNPAGVEIGLYRSLLADDAAKKRCLDFMSEMLPSQTYRALLQKLDPKKDAVTSSGLTIEITPPTDDDAYGGWWVSAYYVTALDYFRASPAEIANITVPKNMTTTNSQAELSGWSASDMKLARPSTNLLEINVASISIGGNKYERARIVKRNPAEATIYHSTGVATYPLAQFSPDIQRTLGYDPTAADAYIRTQAESQKAATQEKTEAQTQQPAQATVDDAQSYDSDRVYVRGYYRKNGTYVHSYTRRR